MSKWRARRQRTGRMVQSGVPERPLSIQYDGTGGLLLRGVVVATYELDATDHPQRDTTAGQEPVAIYCDVLCYSSHRNFRWLFFKQVLVSQDIGGMHRGRVWKPRPAKVDVRPGVGELSADGSELDNKANPADLDGDHVLIGFMDDNPNFPVILRGIPHPNADIGNEQKEIGKRLRLKITDGDPDFQKHHGGFYGISDAGDFIVDLTEANKGEVDANGNEPAPPTDGSSGNYTIKLPQGSKLNIEIDAGENLELDLKDGSAKLKLGDGAKSALIAEAVQSFWDTVFKPTVFDVHVHGTGVGPSTPPTPLAPIFPTGSISSKMKIPDG